VDTITVRVQRSTSADGMDFTHACGGFLSVVQGTTATFRCEQCHKTWTLRQWPAVIRGLHHFSRSCSSTYKVVQRGLEVRFVHTFTREDARDVQTEPASELVRS